MPASGTASTRPRSTPAARPASSRSTPTSAPTASPRAPGSSSTPRARSSRTPMWSRTWPTSGGAGSRCRAALRRVPGRRPRPGQDRRLGSLQRRRRRPGRSRRPRAGAGPARELGHGRRRDARRGDRQPVQRAELALGRRRLGDRPHDRLADLRLQRLRRDPDRRADQPGQLGWPALRRPGPGDRDQRPDPLDERHGGGRRLRDPDRHRAAGARAAVRTGQVSYAYVGVTTQDVTPGIAKKFGFAAPRGALIAKVEPETPAAPRRPPRGYAQVGLQRPGGLARRRPDREDRRCAGRSAQDVSRAVRGSRPASGRLHVSCAAAPPAVVQVTLAERPA